MPVHFGPDLSNLRFSLAHVRSPSCFQAPARRYAGSSRRLPCSRSSFVSPLERIAETPATKYRDPPCPELRRRSAQRGERRPFESHQLFRPAVTYLLQPLRILKQRPPHRNEIELLAIEASDQFVEGSGTRAFSAVCCNELAGQTDRSN